MWKICLKTFKNNRIRQKFAYFLRNLQTEVDFQICISVPLNTIPLGRAKAYANNLLMREF